MARALFKAGGRAPFSTTRAGQRRCAAAARLLRGRCAGAARGHAALLPGGLAGAAGGGREEGRGQPAAAALPLRRAPLAPAARAAGRRLPRRQGRAALRLPALCHRLPAAPAAARHPPHQGLLPPLRLPVLPLAPGPPAALRLRRQRRARTGALPGRLPAARPPAVPLHLRGQHVQPAAQQQADAHRLHQHAAPGAGEGVRLQHVPLPAAANRDRHLPEPLREAGEDLVPEPTGQAQERRQKQLPPGRGGRPQLQMLVPFHHQVLGRRRGLAHVSVLLGEGRQRPRSHPLAPQRPPRLPRNCGESRRGSPACSSADMQPKDFIPFCIICVIYEGLSRLSRPPAHGGGCPCTLL